MQNLRNILGGLLVVGLVLEPVPLRAQRVRIPTIRGDAPAPSSAPGVTLGQPVPTTEGFDPYATTPAQPPATVPGAGTVPPAFGTSPAPQYTPPAVTVPGQPYIPYVPGGPQPLGPTPGFPPQQPPAVFPDGITPPAIGPYLPAVGAPNLRFFQQLFFRHTWLEGDTGREVDMNETEIAVTGVIPKFFHSPQPLRLTPGFTLDLLDGPAPPEADARAELPAQLYAGYLDVGWNPQYTPQLGMELNFRVGVYTDFDTVTTDSVRFMGTALGVVQITPTVTVKVGVEYLDRARIKILPAGGLLWEPNDKTKFDIYFPRPRLAQYLVTIGNTDFWWYLGGEYGGGSWTFERQATLTTERIDINDIRFLGGLEWTCTGSAKGFVEVGYVFDREIVYVVGPPLEQKLRDTFMLRGGLSF